MEKKVNFHAKDLILVENIDCVFEHSNVKECFIGSSSSNYLQIKKLHEKSLFD